MDARRLRSGRLPIVLLLLVLAANLAITAAFADGWITNDNGNDNPDNEIWWFAPNSNTHASWWWDDSSPSPPPTNPMDQIVDQNLQWRSDVQYWFNNEPDKNYVHEVRAARAVEATDWYWTDLPAPQKNEDDGEFEESMQDSEEKELGWDYPSSAIPNGPTQRVVYTGFHGTTYEYYDAWFEAEAEFTRCEWDCWFPHRWDVLGRMQGRGFP